MNSNKKQNMQLIFKEPKFIIPIIAIIGIAIRFYIFPFDIPFKLDNLDIFTYAVMSSQTGNIPVDFVLDNNGWPLLLSLFFSTSNLENFFQLIHLQRLLGMCFSILTIIPIYYLASKFFNRNLAIIAVSLFIFDFRLIIDSVSGGNIPIFIFLITLGFCLFFSKQKMIYLSFVVFALASIIRYEGLLIFIPISIMYCIRFRKQKIPLLKYFIAISLAILVLLPMAYLRVENTGTDGFTNNVIGISSYYNNELLTGYSAQCPHDDPECVTKMINDESWTAPGKDNLTPFIISALSGLVKYFTWSTIPTFFLFLIPATFFMIKDQKFKRINYKIWTLIFSCIFLLLPAFYAYGRHFEELKYLFIIFPLVCIFCLNGLNFKLFNQSRFLIFIIITMILIISVGVIVYKDLQSTNQYDHEVFEIINYVTNNVDGINYFHPESQFVKSSDAYNKWPDTLDVAPRWTSHVLRVTNLIDSADFNSLEKFIIDSKADGLTHLYVDGKDFRNKIENDVFYNEKNYPYLTKQYDSRDYGLEYHVKIFKIDYEKFHLLDG